MQSGRVTGRFKTTALPSHNKKVAAFVRFAHSGEHGSRCEPRRQLLDVKRKQKDSWIRSDKTTAEGECGSRESVGISGS